MEFTFLNEDVLMHKRHHQMQEVLNRHRLVLDQELRAFQEVVQLNRLRQQARQQQ